MYIFSFPEWLGQFPVRSRVKEEYHSFVFLPALDTVLNVGQSGGQEVIAGCGFDLNSVV